MTIKLAYKIREAAEAYGVSDKKIRAAIAAGTLKAKRAGKVETDGRVEGVGEYLISAKALQDWFDGLVDA